MEHVKKKTNPNHYCIIPAAGIGTRMQKAVPKQYLTIHNKTVLEYSLQPFLDHPKIKKIIVVLHPQDLYWSSLKISSAKKIHIAMGGKHRSDSLLAGLLLLQQWAEDEDWVLVHDAARPCIQSADIDHICNSLQNHPVGGLMAMPMVDTIKRVNHEAREVEETIIREHFWYAQTPQMFRFGKLLEAYQQAVISSHKITDSASGMELLGEKPLLVQGRRENIKITFPEDLSMVENIIMSKKKSSKLSAFDLTSSLNPQSSIPNPRIGHGYDSHRFGVGKNLMIGGIAIPFEKGIVAHSDGDVIIHALCDALLGAAALGDIGQHFPDTSPEFKNMSSTLFLEKVIGLLQKRQLHIGNVDITVLAEKPKLAEYIPLMREHLAHTMQIELNQISIKAKTNEKMGFIGREEGIAAQVVVLLCQSNKPND